MYQAICEHLRAGKSIVNGSGNFRRSERQMVRDLADPARDEAITIYVDTPAHIARQGLLANRENGARLDITDDDFEHILRAWEPPLPDENAVVFPYKGEIDTWIVARMVLLAVR